MGSLIIDELVSALIDAGIVVDRGFYAGKIPWISESVAAVNLESMDLRSKKVTVLVTVLTPGKLGGPTCEDQALQVGQVLAQQGGKCTLGKCRFDPSSDMFYLEITAVFNSETPAVLIDGTRLNHVLAFTSWRTLDDEVTDWTLAKWQFRLEEYFPNGEEEYLNPVNPFTLIHLSEDGSETYTGCTWTYQKREWDASGVRQIRLGVAEEMDYG